VAYFFTGIWYNFRVALTLEENIVRKHAACLMIEEEAGEGLEPPMGTGALHTPVAETVETTAKRRSHLRT